MDGLIYNQHHIPKEEHRYGFRASANVGCPPAVPIAVSGERLDENALAAFRYYGIDSVCVIK